MIRDKYRAVQYCTVQYSTVKDTTDDSDSGIDVGTYHNGHGVIHEDDVIAGNHPVAGVTERRLMSKRECGCVRYICRLRRRRRRETGEKEKELNVVK